MPQNPLMKVYIRFGKGLVPDRQQAVARANVDPDLC